MKRSFWQVKPLSQLTRHEWEQLCDRCACCCAHKTSDERGEHVRYTPIACHHLDITRCRCTCYEDRARRAPECIDLFAADPGTFDWLPPHCAYRRLAAGQDLPAFHPLLTGDPQSPHKAGMSARTRLVHGDPPT